MNKKTARCLTGGLLHSMTSILALVQEFIIDKVSKRKIYCRWMARHTGFLEAIETRFYFWTYCDKSSQKNM